MRRLALESAVLSLLASTVVFPVTCYGKPKPVRLPMLEVPDDLGLILRKPNFGSRATLLRSPVELSDANDRRVLAREQRMWGRLNGSLCVGCGAAPAPALRKVSYVDPVAVLNAKPSVVAQPVLASRTAAPARAASVHLAHRYHHRSRLYAYYSRLRYAVLKWRRHHPRRRVRAVQHVPASPA